MERFDLIIIGGGIVGLWSAYFAAQRGLNTVLVEEHGIAAGASGGLLGALMPHSPDRWNAKKQFQFEALTQLPGLVDELESRTGQDVGYRRVGRVAPLLKDHHVKDVAARATGAQDFWQVDDGGFAMQHMDAGPAKDWPAVEAMPYGVAVDNLSARLSPRKLIMALAGALHGRIDLRFGTRAAFLGERQVTLGDGSVLHGDKILVSAGLASFDMLRPYAPEISGRGVKGQAAVLDTNLDPNLPIIYSDGVYLIVHDDGTTAIGSTSEKEFTDGRKTDHLLDEVVEKARALSPLIKDAPVIERWAGVRPQAQGRDPLLGALPHSDWLYVATGGFKISFGIAHLMAQSVLGEICADVEARPIPDEFAPRHRLAS
ncbi:NAD(P)/FAD-dependent oxidoreductase [Maritalea mediterranea]|uniref:FAD-binding oxidoreductase n=1 Tax=Maritalea mediterranea TaxID=2909667 RepID=A0ABS9E3E8_9HYPH|nr:FAD-dependent oxidoreductase [Maritalea mediterranea]MCF4097386.1 FAD-binding oxidoreductase [Maritalea mediterranea]